MHMIPASPGARQARAAPGAQDGQPVDTQFTVAAVKFRTGRSHARLKKSPRRRERVQAIMLWLVIKGAKPPADAKG